MAHLDYRQEAVLDAIVNRLLSDMDSMNPRDFAELLSALALLKHQPVAEAMSALVQHANDLLQDPGESSAARTRIDLLNVSAMEAALQVLLVLLQTP